MNARTKIEAAHAIDAGSVNRVVCIMSYTSSASCLMSSLLDGHPNVLITPDNILGDFQDFWEKHGRLHLEPLLCEFREHYALIFDARIQPKDCNDIKSGETYGFTTLGPDRDEYLKVDGDAFQHCMRELIGDTHPVPRKLFFQALHVAYSKALGRDVREPIIAFGLHSLIQPWRLQGLTEDFSDLYFLQMVRHPIRALASGFRGKVRLGANVSRAFARSMLGIARGGVTAPSTAASRWRAIRMEDLHREPEKTLRKVCNWLDLPWNDVLLESTINGKQWWNMKQSLQVSGFSNAIASQSFEDYLPKFDRIRLSILLSRKCTSWDYDVPRWSQNLVARLLVLPLLLIPFKMERLARPSLKGSFRQHEGPLMRRAWHSSLALIIWFVKGRVELIRAWFLTFGGRHSEVQLL